MRFRDLALGLWLAAAMTEISAAAEERWRVPLAGRPDLGDRLVIEGSGSGPTFTPRHARIETSAAGNPVALTPLPLDTPLLPRLVSAPFGHEERARLTAAQGRVLLSCQPGSKPAGLVLDARERLPMGAELSLRLDMQADADFLIGVGPTLHDPAMTAPLPSDGWIALGAIAPDVAPRLTVLCPAAGGTLSLKDLRLAARDQARPARRSGWAWQPALWRDEPQRLIDAAKALHLGTLYVSVEIEPASGLVSADRFTGFVARARTEGIGVVVVEGDAAMALPAGRALALQRLRHLDRHRQAAAPASRFDGVQYDIEPYLLPDFVQTPEAVMHAWAQTIAALRAATTAELDVVLPFWLMSDEHAQRHVMPALRQGADSITIMAYRTEPQAIIAAAEPLLAWAGRSGLRARIALENGPLPDEAQRIYRRQPAGDVRIERDGDGRYAAVLDPDGRGGARFAFSHEIAAPAANVSFLGDRARFLSVLARVEHLLSAWPAFAGMALHGAIE